MKSGVFIFRRDLRMEDNRGLNECAEQCESVYPIFIFNPKQFRRRDYFSPRQFKFFLECLFAIHKHVSFFLGDDIEVLKKISKEIKIDGVFFNIDFTPFARDRDNRVAAWCEEQGIACVREKDYLLSMRWDDRGVVNGKGEYYEKFSPFYQKARKKKVEEIEYKTFSTKLLSIRNKTVLPRLMKEYDAKKVYPREEGLAILEKIKEFSSYGKMRDMMNYRTTQLSKFIRFGQLSIREVYFSFRSTSEKLLRQLYWRDFFYYLGIKKPEILTQKKNFTSLSLRWRNNKEEFRKWKRGETGCPIVDACMRQLNQTGFIENRKRLIVADFLTKVYQIDWRYGEKYFAEQLIDYDPIVNNLSWQSVIFDYQAYTRMYNPWLQQKKYDPDFSYVRKMLPKEFASSKDQEIKDVYKNFEKFYEERRKQYFEKIKK